MNCSPNNNSPSLLSPRRLCDCHCWTVNLHSCKSFSISGKCQTYILHRLCCAHRACLAVQIVESSPRLTLLESSRTANTLCCHEAAVPIVTVQIIQLPNALTYAFISRSSGELPRNLLGGFRKSKMFCWAQAKTYF